MIPFNNTYTTYTELKTTKRLGFCHSFRDDEDRPYFQKQMFQFHNTFDLTV